MFAMCLVIITGRLVPNIVIVSRQIVALINEYKEKYLNTHLPD